MKIPTMVLILCAALFVGACGSEQTATTNKVKMENAEDKTENTIFPKGEKAAATSRTKAKVSLGSISH